MDKHIGGKKWIFVFIYDNNSNASVCAEMEGLPYMHNGRMDDEVNGVGKIAKIDCFD